MIDRLDKNTTARFIYYLFGNYKLQMSQESEKAQKKLHKQSCKKQDVKINDPRCGVAFQMFLA